MESFDKDFDGSNTPLPDITDISGDGKPDVDLRIQGSSALINGVNFSGGILNSGTGNFNDFLGIQNNPNEFGFNSAITNDPSNPYLKTSTNFTHTICSAISRSRRSTASSTTTSGST